MREDFVDDYKWFLETLGEKSQRITCVEEMAELTKALCKFERVQTIEARDEVLSSIKEEIADVLNMVEQLEYIYGCDEIEKIRKMKILRTKERFEKSGN